jgi:hypothetical protein
MIEVISVRHRLFQLEGWHNRGGGGGSKQLAHIWGTAEECWVKGTDTDGDK